MRFQWLDASLRPYRRHALCELGLGKQAILVCVHLPEGHAQGAEGFEEISHEFGHRRVLVVEARKDFRARPVEAHGTACRAHGPDEMLLHGVQVRRLACTVLLRMQGCPSFGSCAFLLLDDVLDATREIFQSDEAIVVCIEEKKHGLGADRAHRVTMSSHRIHKLLLCNGATAPESAAAHKAAPSFLEAPECLSAPMVELRDYH
mmetsp:Transcript_52854/g.113253  ORF Transcript_52854/g.113253 Transcript_52854/m.113253 type:complete len:204 (+) Transcript_52854:760-1371(+)